MPLEVFKLFIFRLIPNLLTAHSQYSTSNIDARYTQTKLKEDKTDNMTKLRSLPINV